MDSALTTDGIVTILVALCIGGLAIAWLLVGRRRPKTTANIEAMRLQGREAEVPSGLEMSSANPAVGEHDLQAAEAEVARDADLNESQHEEPVNLKLVASTEEEKSAEPVRKPDPAPFETLTAAAARQAPTAMKKPKLKTPSSPQQASAMSIAAALIRTDKLEAETEMQAKPPALTEPRGGAADDLTLIRGVGPKLAERLHELGVHHFDQIAAWTVSEATWVDSKLEGFDGRVLRDGWVEQARALVENPAKVRGASGL